MTTESEVEMAVEVSKMECSDEDSAKRMRDMMGPQQVDQFIRQAISICWMMLPKGKKSAEAVEREIRRLVDRALKDLKEDVQAFAIDDTQPSTQKRKKR